MTTDLWMLVWSAALTLAIPNIYIAGYAPLKGALAWGMGNRDDSYEMPAWVNRSKRAHVNMLENLAPFAVLVLVTHVAGKANATTAMWATVFFWSRVVHFVVYAVGIPYVRTLVFIASLVAQVRILRVLLA